MKIAILPGDGIGPDILREAVRVLENLRLPRLTLFEGHIGGEGYRKQGHRLPAETLHMARAADAVLLGAVADPGCEELPQNLRPEQTILALCAELGLFICLCPAELFQTRRFHLLPGATLSARKTAYGTFGLYHPIYGGAAGIAEERQAHPIGAIRSAAMMLRHSFGREEEAARIERAVASALDADTRGGDSLDTAQIGDAVLERL